jgi:hypothetical protein
MIGNCLLAIDRLLLTLNYPILHSKFSILHCCLHYTKLALNVQLKYNFFEKNLLDAGCSILGARATKGVLLATKRHKMHIHASLLWSYAGQGEHKGFRQQKMTKKVLYEHINSAVLQAVAHFAQLILCCYYSSTFSIR